MLLPAAGVPGLWMVETLSQSSAAEKLNRYWGLRESASSSSPLKVMVQVNTSGEESELLYTQSLHTHHHTISPYIHTQASWGAPQTRWKTLSNSCWRTALISNCVAS